MQGKAAGIRWETQDQTLTAALPKQVQQSGKVLDSGIGMTKVSGRHRQAGGTRVAASAVRRAASGVFYLLNRRHLATKLCRM